MKGIWKSHFQMPSPDWPGRPIPDKNQLGFPRNLLVSDHRTNLFLLQALQYAPFAAYPFDTHASDKTPFFPICNPVFPARRPGRRAEYPGAVAPCDRREELSAP
jgi:hypothetical protein